MESGSSESPASLKRVTSPAGKPAVSGEGEIRTQIMFFKRVAEVTWYRVFALRLGVTLKETALICVQYSKLHGNMGV